MDAAITMLAKVLGDQRARGLVADSMYEARLVSVKSPQDLLAVADKLIHHGGFVEVVGRSLKTKALLGGARLAL